MTIELKEVGAEKGETFYDSKKGNRTKVAVKRDNESFAIKIRKQNFRGNRRINGICFKLFILPCMTGNRMVVSMIGTSE